MRQILLFTDFGWQGPYVGQMVAVLHDLAPDCRVVPVMSDAPCGDPERSGYLLDALVRVGPPGAVWVCVVDPGVGGPRRGLFVQADDRWLVGPDNGLLAPVLRNARRRAVWSIDWHPAALSATFHGRDLFAPVAARLARGESVESTVLDPASVAGADGPADLWEVIYVDGFGNAMTGIGGAGLSPRQVLRVNGHELRHCRTFCDVPPGVPFWYTNSSGLVEIAVNRGRADRQLGISRGTPVMRPD